MALHIRRLLFSTLRIVALVASVSWTFRGAAQSDSTFEEDEALNFFHQHEKVTDPGSVSLVLKGGKSSTLNKFLSDNDFDQSSENVLADLDHDGKKELVTWNYTGGAHCCDVITIFRETEPRKYRYAAQLFAGNANIMEGDTIGYNLYEGFGYFFTCYACTYDDSAAGIDVIQSIELLYRNGSLEVVPGNSIEKKVILDNLDKLSRQPWQPMDDDLAQDNGLRKEYALNLAVYYFDFGQDMKAVKLLFDNSYKHPDAKDVWKNFVSTIYSVKDHNDF